MFTGGKIYYFSVYPIEIGMVVESCIIEFLIRLIMSIEYYLGNYLIVNYIFN